MWSGDLFEQFVCAATWDQKATAESNEGLPYCRRRKEGNLDAFTAHLNLLKSSLSSWCSLFSLSFQILQPLHVVEDSTHKYKSYSYVW